VGPLGIERCGSWPEAWPAPLRLSSMSTGDLLVLLFAVAAFLVLLLLIETRVL
jgi:hypothetical protein